MRCSCSRNRLLERFALGLEKWSLYLFAKSCRSRTHPGSLGVVSFRAEDSGITFQAPGDVAGAAECAKAHEGLPVACFRQIVALLLACQVTEHGCHDRDVPRHPANACIGESFFQERSGML